MASNSGGTDCARLFLVWRPLQEPANHLSLVNSSVMLTFTTLDLLPYKLQGPTSELFGKQRTKPQPNIFLDCVINLREKVQEVRFQHQARPAEP